MDESFPNEARYGFTGDGIHRLYFNYATAVARPDHEKRSRILTSQTVGAWVKSDQFRRIAADNFEAEKALSPVKCIFRNHPCSFNPIKSSWVPNSVAESEDIWRMSSSTTKNA